MITEEHVWAYLVESNPIPDLGMLDDERVDGAAYLATLEDRSSEMTQLETKKNIKQDDPRGNGRWLAIAAVVVVALAAAALLFATNREPEPAVPDPETSLSEWLHAEDYATYSALMTDEAAAGYLNMGNSSSSPEEIDEELAALGVLGQTYLVANCVEVDIAQNNFRCEVTTTNSITEAFGQERQPTIESFIFNEDGLLIADPRITWPIDLASFKNFARNADLVDELNQACPSGYLHLTCADMIIDHLDAWVASVNEQ